MFVIIVYKGSSYFSVKGSEHLGFEYLSKVCDDLNWCTTWYGMASCYEKG